MTNLTIDIQFPLVLAHGPLSLDQAVEQITHNLDVIKRLTNVPQKEYFTVGTKNHESGLVYSRAVYSPLEAVEYANQVCSYLFNALTKVDYKMWIRSDYQDSINKWLESVDRKPNRFNCIKNKV